MSMIIILVTVLQEGWRWKAMRLYFHWCKVEVEDMIKDNEKHPR